MSDTDVAKLIMGRVADVLPSTTEIDQAYYRSYGRLPTTSERVRFAAATAVGLVAAPPIAGQTMDGKPWGRSIEPSKDEQESGYERVLRGPALPAAERFAHGDTASHGDAARSAPTAPLVPRRSPAANKSIRETPAPNPSPEPTPDPAVVEIIHGTNQSVYDAALAAKEAIRRRAALPNDDARRLDLVEELRPKVEIVSGTTSTFVPVPPKK